MEHVGVRELKARLSAYLRRATAGERLAVTDRGQVVAVIGPVEELERPVWVAQLVAEGRASWGGSAHPVGLYPRIRTKGLLASTAVIEDRR